MIQDISQIKECPDCASNNIVHSEARDQVICRECGLIFEPLSPMLEEKFEKTHGIKSKPAKAKKAAKKTVKKTSKKKKK